MATELPDGMIVLVTGSTLRAEQMDRPLAYYLKSEIERRANGRPDRMVLVVADFRWMHDKEVFEDCPTISLGGPGVNALAHTWLEDEPVPVTLAVEQRFCIQMDPRLNKLRASIWGMDNIATQIAVGTFVEKFLPRFLAASWTDEEQDDEEDDSGVPYRDDDEPGEL